MYWHRHKSSSCQNLVRWKLQKNWFQWVFRRMSTFHLLKSGSPILMVIILLAYCLKHNTDKDFIVLIKMIKEAVNDQTIEVPCNVTYVRKFSCWCDDQQLEPNLSKNYQKLSYQKNFKVYKLNFQMLTKQI